MIPSRPADNVYINVTVNNKNPNGLKKVANFTAEYENPLIDNPSEYSLAVVKFQIPLDELPLFILPVTPGQTITPGSGTPINTPLQVGVYQVENPATIIPPIPNPPTPANFPETVTWVSTWWNYPVPTNGVGAINLDDPQAKYSPIMYVYSYQSLINRVNLALNASWVAAGSPGGAAPYYILQDDKFKLVLPVSLVTAGWSVFVNIDALQGLQGFNYVISSDQLRFQLPVDGLATSANFWVGADLTPAAVPVNYLIAQEYPNFEYLSSARKLIMTTNTIPCRKEYYPVPSNSTTPSSVTGVNNGLGIIADFQLDLTNRPGEQRSIATYEADLYRMVDLNSTHPLRKIDLNFYWADEFNNLFPLYISPYGVINVKLGFFRKDSSKVPENVPAYDVVGNGRGYY